MDRNTAAAYFLGLIIVTTMGGYYWLIVRQPSTMQIHSAHVAESISYATTGKRVTLR